MRALSLIPATAMALLAAFFTGNALAETETYTIDPTHTFVYFEVMHYKTATVRGRFDKTEGSVALDRQARHGQADITIHTTSINSGIPAFDGMLKSDKFFDAANHPQARFTSSKFAFTDDAGIAAVDGTLTLRGKTAAVRLKARHFNCYQHPVVQRQVCGGDFVAEINRRDWGISSYDVIPDDVRLVIQIEAVRQ